MASSIRFPPVCNAARWVVDSINEVDYSVNMETKQFLTIAEIREWLKRQREERIPGGGIRALAESIGVHENVLYRIISGKNPGYRTAGKLRDYFGGENARQH